MVSRDGPGPCKISGKQLNWAKVEVGKEKEDTKGSWQQHSAVLSLAGSRKELESRQERKREGGQPGERKETQRKWKHML